MQISYDSYEQYGYVGGGGGMHSAVSEWPKFVKVLNIPYKIMHHSLSCLYLNVQRDPARNKVKHFRPILRQTDFKVAKF